MTSKPLRVAVPNKGTLSETAVEMLVEAGYVEKVLITIGHTRATVF